MDEITGSGLGSEWAEDSFLGNLFHRQMMTSINTQKEEIQE